MRNIHFGKYVLRIILTFLVILIFAFYSLSANDNSINQSIIKTTNYDLVVVGTSPGGISCAVRAAREGLKVLLVERTKHVGVFYPVVVRGWKLLMMDFVHLFMLKFVC